MLSVKCLYMSVNSKHWSEVKRTIWFDPDTVVQQTGSSVDLWNSSSGGSTAKTDPLIVTNPSDRPMLVRNSVNGHNQIYFPGVNVAAKLLTISNASDALGGDTQINGNEATVNDLLKKFLEEGRLVV